MNQKLKNKIYYGWVVLTVVVIASIILLGVRHSYGVFFKSISTEFDLSRATTSAIFSAFMAISALFAILGGWSMDRYGPKITLSLMGLLTLIGLLLTGWVTSVWQLYLSYSLLLAAGTGATFNATSALVSRWFNKKRGLALGINNAGSGLGTIILAPLATYLILNFDWRIANIVLGVIAGVVIIPASFLLKRNPAELGLLPDGASSNNAEIKVHQVKSASGYSTLEAVKTSQFCFLFIIWLCQSFAGYFILTHIVPHTTDMGISAMEGARIISIIGAFQILGGVVAGSVSDAIGRRGVLIISSLLGASALFILMWSQTIWLFYISGILIGLGWGGTSPTVVAHIGDIFGMRSIGAILGLMGIAWFGGAALGPAVGGLLYDINQSYFPTFLISAVVMLLAALLATLLTRPRKR